MKSVRYPVGVAFGQLGPLARKQLVNRLMPQLQPPLEVPTPQRRIPVQHRVRRKGTTPIAAGSKQDRLPKRRDLRHVRLEVQARNLCEQPADDGVIERFAVERAYEPLAVLKRGNVTNGRHFAQDMTTRRTARRRSPR